MRALLDRIAEPLPYTTDPKEVLNETVNSVQDELNRLLNCRSYFGNDRRRRGQDTILNYGLADLASVDTQEGARNLVLARKIQYAISCHEPRLSDVEVFVTERRGRLASVEIIADIKAEKRSMRFVVSVDQQNN